MRRILVLALLAAGCNGAHAKPPPIPPPPRGQTVVLKGTPIGVEWLGSDPDRRYAVATRAAIPPGTGVLAAWDRDRILHFFAREDAVYDVAFLSADGRILETGVVEGSHGVTSKVEARSALLLKSGSLAKLGAAAGDRIEPSAELAKLSASPMAQLKVGGATVHAETAHKSDERMRGLMNRRTMSADDGMLFMYRRESDRSFWMMNCHYSLDIAFFTGDRRLLNVVSIDPYADPTVDPGEETPGGRARSDGDAQFVLEVHKGWFRKHGLAGDDGKPLREVKLEWSDELERMAKDAD